MAGSLFVPIFAAVLFAIVLADNTENRALDELKQASCYRPPNAPSHCEKKFEIHPKLNQVVYLSKDTEISLACSIAATSAFHRPLSIKWYFFDIDLDNSVPFRSSPRPQSVEGVSETVNLAHDTPFLYSSVHFNATTARYGLLQCRIDDGASNKSHHRFFLVLPPDIDPRNDSVTGSFLSSSRQEKRLELDPLRPRVVDLNCFSPLSQPSVWSVSTSSVEMDAVTSGRWKNTFTETFETVYFDLVRVNHGLAFAIEPRFGLQWHTLSFEVASITSAQFGSQSEIPFYCSHATFAEKLSYLAHIKDVTQYQPTPPQVALSPSIFAIIDVTTFPSNESRVVTCEASIADQRELPLTFEWLYDYEPFNGEERSMPLINVTSATSSQLYFAHMDSKSEGKYTCRVRNSFNQTSSMGVYLRIIAVSRLPPSYMQPISTATTQYVEVGGRFTLACDVSNGVAHHSTLHFQNPFEPPVQDNQSVLSVSYNRYNDDEQRDAVSMLRYQVQHATPLHAGVYTCLAWNAHGQTKRTITVNILTEQPVAVVAVAGNAAGKVGVEEKTLYIEPASSVRLHCDVTARLANVSQTYVYVVQNNGSSEDVGKYSATGSSSHLHLPPKFLRPGYRVICSVQAQSFKSESSLMVQYGYAAKLSSSGNRKRIRKVVNAKPGKDKFIGRFIVRSWPPPTFNFSQLAAGSGSTTCTHLIYHCQDRSEVVHLGPFRLSMALSDAGGESRLQMSWDVSIRIENTRETDRGNWRLEVGNPLAQTEFRFIVRVRKSGSQRKAHHKLGTSTSSVTSSSTNGQHISSHSQHASGRTGTVKFNSSLTAQQAHGLEVHPTSGKQMIRKTVKTRRGKDKTFGRFLVRSWPPPTLNFSQLTTNSWLAVPEYDSTPCIHLTYRCQSQSETVQLGPFELNVITDNTREWLSGPMSWRVVIRLKKARDTDHGNWRLEVGNRLAQEAFFFHVQVGESSS